MSDKVSVSKYEHEVLPAFRKRMNEAESTEDVKKFFNYTVGDLFARVFDGRVELQPEDISLVPDSPPHFQLAERLSAVGEVGSALGNSDLPAVISRLAASAVHHYRHLEKHPEKTRTKIRSTQ